MKRWIRALRCAVLLRASPGCPSVDTRSAERSEALLQGTASPPCLDAKLCRFMASAPEIPMHQPGGPWETHWETDSLSGP